MAKNMDEHSSARSVLRDDARHQSTGNLVFYLILLGLISSHFAFSYVMNAHQQFDLHDYLNGRAPLPYQYRALPAWVLYLASNTTLARSISAHLPAPFYDPAQLMFLLLVAISMAGMIEITRRCALTVTSDGELAMIFAFLTPTAAYISYVSWANGYLVGFAYDIPALALFGWAYYFILRSNFIGFAIAFFFAALARNTAAFLIVVFLCHQWTDVPSLLRREGLRLAFIAAMYVAVTVFLYYLYGQNLSELQRGPLRGTGVDVPAGFFIFQSVNIENLLLPIYWPSLLSFVGWLWLPVLLGWRRLDHPGVRRTLLVLPALWFLAVMIGGRIHEVRVFGEMIWFFVIGLSIIARNWLMERGYGKRVANCG